MRHPHEILDQMEACLSALKQTDIIGPNFNSIDDLCIEWLKDRHYSVRPPIGYPVKITKLDEIISMFYDFLSTAYQKHLLPPSNIMRDRAIAKAFIEKRMEADKISRKDAMQQCALIVQTVLRTPEVFKFETPPTFGIFGQAEMGWITERAIKIINEQITKDQKFAVEKAVDEMTESIEKNYKMGYSLEELAACQKKLEGQYGKKESKT